MANKMLPCFLVDCTQAWIVVFALWFELSYFICPHTEVSRPPSKVTITKTTEDSITVEWKAPSNDGGARITAYHIQVKEDTPGATWRDAGKVDGYESRFTVKDLQVGKNYKVAVLAENENGLSEPGVADKSAAPKKSVSKCNFLCFLSSLCRFGKNILSLKKTFCSYWESFWGES